MLYNMLFSIESNYLWSSLNNCRTDMVCMFTVLCITV